MLKAKHPLKVFLCHASEDKKAVRELYQHLIKCKVSAWLDEEKILPGQDWDLEILKAIRESDVIIVLLSQKSISKEGYVQKEIKRALDIAKEKPEGTIFVIPVRLDDCNVPESLKHWHWVNLNEINSYGRLLKALTSRSEQIGALLPICEGSTSNPPFKKIMIFIAVMLVGILFVLLLGRGLPIIQYYVNIPTPTTTVTSSRFDSTTPTKTFTPYPSIFTPTKTPANESSNTPTDTQSVTAPETTKLSPIDGAKMVFIPSSKGGEIFWIDQTAITEAMFEKFVENTDYVTDAEKNNIGYVWTFIGEVSAPQFPGQTYGAAEWKLQEKVNWRNPPYDGKYTLGDEVLQVSWNDAKAYCEWAGRSLVTEKEWNLANSSDLPITFYNRNTGLGEWGEDKTTGVYRIIFGHRDTKWGSYTLFSERGFVEYRSANRITFRCKDN